MRRSSFTRSDCAIEWERKAAAADYTLVPLPGMEHQIRGYKVYEGTTDVSANNMLTVDTDLPGTLFVYRTPGVPRPDSGKHTYTVWPLIDGKKLRLSR